MVHLVLERTCQESGAFDRAGRAVPIESTDDHALGARHGRVEARQAQTAFFLELHALRNSLIPVVTIIGLQFGSVLTGTIITETIFAWPGVGRLLVQAIGFRDYPLVQGCILLIAVTYVAMNLLVDLTYGWLDPRIRYE